MSESQLSMEQNMAVYLYIVRHGEAGFQAEKDNLRELTEHGQWQAKRAALWLKSQVGVFQHVYSSPYKRAQQTRDIILEYGPSVMAQEELDELTPDADAKRLVDYLLAKVDENAQEDIHILCVSHMPLVSYIIGELTGYSPIMATAGVAKIMVDLDSWNGELETLIAPETML